MEKFLNSLSMKKSSIEKTKNTKNKEIILSENFERALNDWKLLDISKSTIYKIGSFEFRSDYVVITQEKSIPLKEGFENCKLLSASMIKEQKKKY